MKLIKKETICCLNLPTSKLNIELTKYSDKEKYLVTTGQTHGNLYSSFLVGTLKTVKEFDSLKEADKFINWIKYKFKYSK